MWNSWLYIPGDQIWKKPNFKIKSLLPHVHKTYSMKPSTWIVKFMAPGFLTLQSKVWVTRLPRYMKPLVRYNTVSSINFILILAARNLTSVAWYHASVLFFTRFRKFRTKITTINNEIFILFYFHNENVRFF